MTAFLQRTIIEDAVNTMEEAGGRGEGEGTSEPQLILTREKVETVARSKWETLFFTFENSKKESNRSVGDVKR